MPCDLYRTPFHIDHVVSRQHGGQTVADNLALACFHCNAHKGPNLAGVDPQSSELTRLFHPRLDEWTSHFAWNGAELVGITSVGRATIQVLAINDPVYLAVRQSLLQEGVFPPAS
jgi:hypothetical protein